VAAFVLNHCQDVLDKYELIEWLLGVFIDLYHMGQTVCVVLFLFREFKDVNCVNASNTQQLDVFLDNKGHYYVFLCIF